MRLVRSGDERAFGTLLARHGARVRRRARAVLDDPVYADEVMQETFVRLFRSLDRIEVGDSLLPWLNTVATNLARDLIRSLRRESRTQSLERSEGRMPASPLVADQRAMASETSEAIRRALSRLSPDRRQVVELRFWHGYSYEEIARATGVASGTVASRIHRALEDLRHVLSPTNVGADAHPPPGGNR